MSVDDIRLKLKTWKAMDYTVVTNDKRNEHVEFPQNDSEAHFSQLSDSLTTVFSTSTTDHSILAGNGTADSKKELQYYVIGVYSFFAFVFTIGLIMALARRINKACCPRNSSRPGHGESSSPNGHFIPQDNPGFEHQVNVDYLDGDGTYHYYDSDYENYSDVSNEETKSLKEKPPAYEEPPSYLVASQSFNASLVENPNG